MQACDAADCAGHPARRPGHRPGRAVDTAAVPRSSRAQPVDGQDAVTIAGRSRGRADQLMPPAAARAGVAGADITVGGNAALHHHRRRTGTPGPQVAHVDAARAPVAVARHDRRRCAALALAAQPACTRRPAAAQPGGARERLGTVCKGHRSLRFLASSLREPERVGAPARTTGDASTHLSVDAVASPAGVGTVRNLAVPRLPRLQRACPSAGLDECRGQGIRA